MWKCELCGKKAPDTKMAIELKFGYVDSDLAKHEKDQWWAFCTEEGLGPICDDCAIGYIKGEIHG